MGNNSSEFGDIKSELYRESEKIGLSKLEVDALFVISKYVLEAMGKGVHQLEEMPWNAKTRWVFRHDRRIVLRIYLSVFQHFNLPFNELTVPFHREFAQNPTIGHLVLDIKEQIIKFYS